MSRVTLTVAGALLAMLAGLIGHWYGYGKGSAAGALQTQARHDAQAVKDLAQLLENNHRLIDDANTASQRLRAATRQISQSNTQFMKDFNDALTTTAAARAGCVFDAGVLQQLEAARQRAAAAAAAGLARGDAATVPAATGAAGSQRR